MTMLGKRLFALRIVDESAWSEHVLAALALHNGNAVHAARALEVSHRTMARWIKSPRIAGALMRVRARPAE